MHGEYAETKCGTVVWTKYPVEWIREKGFKLTTRVHSVLHIRLLFVFFNRLNSNKLLYDHHFVCVHVADEQPNNILT